MSEEEDEKKEPADREDALGEPEEQEENEKEEEKKEGFRLRQLSGPQACLAIMGCGTLAAVVVIGSVIGLFNLFFSSSSEDSDDPGGAVSTWEPPPSMDPGALDLCSSLESSGETGSFRELGPQRIDSGSEYFDTEIDDPGADFRTVGDECSWSLVANDWNLSLTYEAYVSVEGASTPEEYAMEDFSSRKTEVGSMFESISTEEEPEGIGDESYVVYGNSVEDPDEMVYIFVSRTRGGVYAVSINAGVSEEGDPEDEMLALVRDISSVVDVRLERVLPS